MIGPSFECELQEAGVLALPFSWTESGVIFGDQMTLEQVADIQAVIDAHDPTTAAPPEVPTVVSRFQGREAMWRTPHGETTLFEAVETIINSPETPAMYKRAWDDLQEFRSDSEMLAVLSAMVPLTRDQVVGLFILAESIKA